MSNFDQLQHQKVIACFSNSAMTYQRGAQLQLKVGQGCLDRMKEDLLVTDVKVALDLGCGPGLFTKQLQTLADDVVSLDLSTAMLRRNSEGLLHVQADSHSLPIVTASIDTIFSSLMIQWCDIDRVLAEIHRVLVPGGKAIVSTLLCGTLGELESAWSSVDDDNHIHQYLNQNQVLKAMNAIDWKIATLEQEQHVFEFGSVKELARELKLLGASYVKDRKNKGLTSKSKWQKMESAYREQSQLQAPCVSLNSNNIPATYNVAYMILEK